MPISRGKRKGVGWEKKNNNGKEEEGMRNKKIEMENGVVLRKVINESSNAP